MHIFHEHNIASSVLFHASAMAPTIAREQFCDHHTVDIAPRTQAKMDAWYEKNKPAAGQPPKYPQESFLKEIGYLVDRPEPFSISTSNVDPELAQVAGPQLVVPVDNARYALNAANARWGSLFDAVYGTDVLGDNAPDKPKDGKYSAARGMRVIEFSCQMLDRIAPFAEGKWAVCKCSICVRV